MKLRMLLILNLAWVGPVADAAFPPIRLDPISQGQIVSPVLIGNAGDGSDRLFVADQRGQIRVIDQGNLLPTPLLDLETLLVPERPNFDERGLLGLAFHPNFGQSGLAGADKFYVYYSAPTADAGTPENPIDHQSVVAEFSVSAADPNVADLASARTLLTFDQPQFNHNAGFLAFGPDDMLYVATGDGGGGGDNEPGHTGGGPGAQPDAVTGNLGNSQDRSNLLGKILRIDVDGNNGPGGEYGIPADNPFVGEGGVREEIYAYGLRNPFRGTFDGDRLIVADVGQNQIEEINLIEAGGNYGWRILEGTFDFDNTVTPDPVVPLIDPIAEYTHPGLEPATGLEEFGISVTGGVVYRGDAFPELQGKYLFGDFSTQFAPANGMLLGMEETSPGVFSLQALDVVGGNPIGEYVLAFGLDESGEAYVATKTALAASGLSSTGEPTGAIYRIVVVPEPTTALIAATLLSAVLISPRRPRRPRRRLSAVGCGLSAVSSRLSAVS